MEFGQAIKRPFQEIGKTILLSVLSIIPIINFFALGYGLEVARGVWRKKTALPEWVDWGNLWVHGLLTLIIQVIYGIPALILVGIGVATDSAALYVLAGVYGLFLIPVLPAAILMYATNFNFSEAFKFGEVVKRGYRGQFILAIILAAIWGFILYIPMLIPVVGWIWIALLGYGAMMVTGYSLLADAY